jgi:hypothetical protein
LGERTVLLEQEKPPRQLDHAVPHARVARAGQSLKKQIREIEQTRLVATGRGGCQGFVQWLALHEPKTAAALFARVLPHFITVTEVPPVASDGMESDTAKDVTLKSHEPAE